MTDTPAERGGDSTWARLRRRKVVQWGLVYVAAAWGFLQGLEYVGEAFHWPDQLRQIALIALLIGLPVVLVLAWYHGDRGQQRITTPEFAILTLLLLLGGGAFWYYQHSTETERDAATADTPARPERALEATDARPSVAVLPFENRSDVEKDAFFVDGIHDDILTQLSKVSALRVISRTSVEQFRDTKLPMKAIADQLGVTKILEGGVQRAGDRVRIHVQLIDASSDAHLWAETYDRELTATDIFAVQSEVAAAVARALSATLTSAERANADAVPTKSLEAWEAYQLGKHRTAKRTGASLIDAERFFRRALEIDPHFALAYAGLADALVLQIDYSSVPTPTALAKADEAIETALRLDPALGEAWASAGLVAASRQEFDRAEHNYRRAIELNPNYAPARYWLSQLLTAIGRVAESVAEAGRAVELDPLSSKANESSAIALAAMGRWEEAEARLRKAIEIDPARPAPYLILGTMRAYAQNRFTDAALLLRRALKLDTADPSRIIDLAVLYFDLGDDSEANRLLNAALERWPEDTAVLEFAASVKLMQHDLHAASQHALKVLEVEPRSIALRSLTMADRRKGDYAAARARYAGAYPEFFAPGALKLDGSTYWIAIDLVPILQKTGEGERARMLLDRSEQVMRTLPRLGRAGYWVTDVQIHALRGDRAKAIAALRDAATAGWRSEWRYHRDIDPNLDSIRNEPEFKAVFADIERDMARQRAALAARPKDAPLELAGTGT